MQLWSQQKWSPRLDWETPAGAILRKAAAAIQHLGPVKIIVFGSCPLQMGVSSGILSGDVDLIGDTELEAELGRHHLLKEQAGEPYIEVCPANTFNTANDWPSRAHSEEIGTITFIFPHPIDILVSKVRRLEEKDAAAFETVREVTGHPTEKELKEALRRAVDIYRPGFDEEMAFDPIANTQLLWQRLFQKEIDPRAEIIAPALKARRIAIGEDLAASPLYRNLKRMGEPPSQ